MGLLRYIGRRIIFLFFLIIGVSLMVFLISHTVPSDPVVANLSQEVEIRRASCRERV